MRGLTRFPASAIGLLLSLASLSCGDSKITPSGNRPPDVPELVAPANNANIFSFVVELNWSVSDPDSDSVVSDLYLGTTSDPPLIAQGLTADEYVIDSLYNDSTYYWRILARDNSGHSTGGPLWRFTVDQTPGFHLIGQCEITQPSRYQIGFYEDLSFVVGGNYVDIIDISNPQIPVRLSSYGRDSWIPEDIFSDAVISGDMAYFIRYEALEIVSISDPYNPIKLNTIHEPSYLYDLGLNGSYLYGGQLGRNLIIWNIDIPETPNKIAEIDSGGTSELTVIGNHAFGHYYKYPPGNTWIYSYNLADPSNPRIEDEILASDHGIHGMHVTDSYLYIADYHSRAIKLFNITDPGSIVHVSDYVSVYRYENICVDGELAYAIIDGGDVQILSVADPSHLQSLMIFHPPTPCTITSTYRGYVYLTGENGTLYIYGLVPE